MNWALERQNIESGKQFLDSKQSFSVYELSCVLDTEEVRDYVAESEKTVTMPLSMFVKMLKGLSDARESLIWAEDNGDELFSRAGYFKDWCETEADALNEAYPSFTPDMDPNYDISDF